MHVVLVLVDLAFLLQSLVAVFCIVMSYVVTG
jgi:hypothetical protein